MGTARSGFTAPPINRAVLREVAAWKLRELVCFAGLFWQFLAVGLINEQMENADPSVAANDLAAIRLHAYQFLVHWAGWERYCHGLGLDPVNVLSPGINARLLTNALAMAHRYTVDAEQAGHLLSLGSPEPAAAPTPLDVLTQIGNEYRTRYDQHHTAKPGRYVGRQN